MRNSIQQGNRECMVAIRAGSIEPADFVHWETARLILNQSSANWHNTIIKAGRYSSGSVVLKTQTTGQRKGLCLSGIILSVLQKGHLMILPVPGVMKN